MARRVLLVFALLAYVTPARAEDDFCRVAKGWLVANAEDLAISPRDLCEALDGSNCSHATTRTEAVCYGFGWGNCRGLETMAPDEVCRYIGGTTNCGHSRNVGMGLCYGVTGGVFGSNCEHADNSGQGICYALSGANCSHAENVGQGFCFGLIGNRFGNNCSFAINAESGLCYARAGINCRTPNGEAEIAGLKERCGW